ncbi:ATP-binding protein [Rathayibacter sp. AY1C4]|nr:ATP-binding protein [Rathayibacter sp. AY1C4]
MRSVGYSLETAIADLVDNSITAGARSIEVDADVVEGRYLAILDDGAGMAPTTAREALRLAGSVGPRQSSDLGRFGLGLKTASLSQARCLTVITKQDSTITALRWDINHIRDTGQWSLISLSEIELEEIPLIRLLRTRKHGTLVLWDDLDLLIGDAPMPGPFLGERLANVRASLSLVFHRYLDKKVNRLQIRVNGIALTPTDPFLSRNPKTQRSAPEIIRINGSEVRVEAFTLPHPSGLSSEEAKRQDLGKEMRQAQGFYVYRNLRLISYGHWYGLAKMSEITKQTRIQVDVPSTLDALWQLDIKKSRAEPPHSFKLRLRQLIEPILSRGKRVHTFRGRSEHNQIEPVWNKLKTRDGFSYEVNLTSPSVRAVLEALPQEQSSRVADLLKTLAATFPVMDSYVEVASNARAQPPTHEPELLLKRLRDIRNADLLSADPIIAAAQLEAIEPFNTVDGLIGLVTTAWEQTHAAD